MSSRLANQRREGGRRRGRNDVRALAGCNLGVRALGAALAAGAARSAEHLPGETFRDCEQCDEMVVVPAGSFVMGSNAESVAVSAAQGDAPA